MSDLGDVLESGVAHGLRFKVVQNPSHGHLCGYVRTSFTQPWYYSDFNTFPAKLITVHGGLTYGPDENGWVGFDCAHSRDVCKVGGEVVSGDDRATSIVHTVNSVAEECRSVAAQFAAIQAFTEKFSERGYGDA